MVLVLRAKHFFHQLPERRVALHQFWNGPLIEWVALQLFDHGRVRRLAKGQLMGIVAAKAVTDRLGEPLVGRFEAVRVRTICGSFPIILVSSGIIRRVP